ncbi:MAG: hypothetical protein ACKOAY_10565, partial [Haliscomenobacter sp.]
MSVLKKISNALFSTSAAGLYILVFAIAIGVATFIENDFGTSAAQKVVFRTQPLPAKSPGKKHGK